MFEESLAYRRYRPIVYEARDNRKRMSFEEQVLWQNLRGSRMLDLRFRRQHPVEKYIVDFYCISRRLAIEVRGSAQNEDGEFDSLKDLTLAGAGIRIIRFTNSEVRYQLPKVLERIREACGG
jgi:very-short-patch-repair endonuclease